MDKAGSSPNLKQSKTLTYELHSTRLIHEQIDV